MAFLRALSVEPDGFILRPPPPQALTLLKQAAAEERAVKRR